MIARPDIALNLAESPDLQMYDRDRRIAFGQIRPCTPRQLLEYVQRVLGFDVPANPRVPGHQAPLDYLCHSFFEDNQPRDCIVWANRGGGKTQIAAIATLLDIIFKPGIQVRILGGSFEQSSKMHRYLRRMLESDAFDHMIVGNLTGRHVELANGSRVEVLSQSECSVRGQRVHKLRCDEVELFDPAIWEAAQLVTRSERLGDFNVQASIEVFSTMHRAFGLMHRLVSQAGGGEAGARGAQPRRSVFRWNMLDVLEHCPPQRACSACNLWHDCGGQAKLWMPEGFFRIDDAVQQKRRVSPETWSAEMLCQRASRSDSVYPAFDPAVHVFDDAYWSGRCAQAQREIVPRRWIGGIDFGYRAPTVLLWACLLDDVLHVVDELALTGHTTEQTIERALQRSAAHGWPKLHWIGADPAGHQHNEHTGRSTISMWRKAGWMIRTRASQIDAGIRAVRARLLSADGRVRLRVHRRCASLIKALSEYHYPADEPESLTPVKDGHDHAADALRYMVVNLDQAQGQVIVREY